MDINRVIMAIFAIGALIGGIDFLIGNRYGFGEKFEEAIKLMPATVFNMVGILCLAPSIAVLLKVCVAPFFRMLHLDPGMLGGILALDMGGYPLAMELSDNLLIGQYAGLLVGSILGCTLVFSIPFGMGVLKEEAKADYIMGIIIGLIAMPAGLLVGGLVLKIPLTSFLYQSLPVIVLSMILIIGLLRFPQKMIRFFQALSKGLKVVINLGLVAGSIVYLLGIKTPYMTSITEGMTVVVNITLALLGSLPFAKLLQVLLKKPLAAWGRKMGISDTACAGILVGLVSAVPVFTMMDDMDQRSRIVLSTFLIDGMAILGAHLAFTATNAPQVTGALLACKLAASIVGVMIACIYTKKG